MALIFIDSLVEAALFNARVSDERGHELVGANIEALQLSGEDVRIIFWTLISIAVGICLFVLSEDELGLWYEASAILLGHAFLE